MPACIQSLGKIHTVCPGCWQGHLVCVTLHFSQQSPVWGCDCWTNHCMAKHQMLSPPTMICHMSYKMYKWYESQLLTVYCYTYHRNINWNHSYSKICCTFPYISVLELLILSLHSSPSSTIWVFCPSYPIHKITEAKWCDLVTNSTRPSQIF